MDEEIQYLASDNDSDATTCNFDLADEEVQMVLDSFEENAITSTLPDNDCLLDRNSNPIYSSSLSSHSDDDNPLPLNLASHDEEVGSHDNKLAACDFERVSHEYEVRSHEMKGMCGDAGCNLSDTITHKSTSHETGFKDGGVEDQTFHRPRFSHSPINMRRPLVLSSHQATHPIQVPAMLNQYLRTYQQEGVQFLYQHFHSNSGAILCDDMGLGKTVQVIAFMSAILGKKGTKADVLLTGPKEEELNLVEWLTVIVDEVHVIKNPMAQVTAAMNSLKERRRIGLTGTALQNNLGEHLGKHLGELRCILNWANPGCLGTSHDFDSEFERPILDGQKLDCTKRQLAVANQRLSELELLTKRWMLRRTKQLVATMLPKKEYVGSATASFKDLVTLLKRILLAEKQCLDLIKQQSNHGHVLDHFQSSCIKLMPSGPIIVRQSCWGEITVELIWIFEEEVVVFCSISELQKQIYQEILETEDAKLVLQCEDPCECFSGKKRGSCCYKENSEGIPWQKLGYSYTTLLSKCVNHLGLLLPGNTTSDHQSDKAMKVCEAVFSQHPQFLSVSRQASFLTLSDVQYCGKMQVIQNLLSRFHANHSKVIVFSNSVILLNTVENYVASQGYTYNRLDGNTKIEDRANLVSQFNTDPSNLVFLISKKCGGECLNVTGANRVIVFDPCWNPTTDLQAKDRVFRIGMSRDVKVFRLIADGTVEEVIYLRQVYKLQLANMALEGSKERRDFQGVAGDQDQKGELFGYNNLWPLGKPNHPAFNLTISLLNKTDCLEAGVKAAPDVLSTHNTGGLSAGEGEVRQVRDLCSHLMPVGTNTIAHSGDKSMIESSSVEDHTRQKALADCNISQQHSQRCANLVTHKLDISDESDEIDSYESKKDATLLEFSSPSYSHAATKTISETWRVKSQGAKIMKVEVEKGESGEIKKNILDRCRLKSVRHRAISRRVMKKRSRVVRKGLQFEDGSPPSVAMTMAKSLSFHEKKLFAAEVDDVSEDVGLPHLECSKEKRLSCLTSSGSIQSYAVFKSKSDSSSLFDVPSSCEPQTTPAGLSTTVDVESAAISINTSIQASDGGDTSSTGRGSSSVLSSSVRFSDVKLYTPSVSNAKRIQKKKQSNGDGIGDSGNSSDRGKQEDWNLQPSGGRISQVEEGFNIDELFGF